MSKDDSINYIAKIIKEYNEKDILIDEKGILKVALRLIKDYRLYDYLTGINYIHDNNGLISFYEPIERKVYIDYNKRINELLEEIDPLNKQEKIAKVNLGLLNTIIKEIMRSKQFSDILKDKNDLEQRVLKQSLDFRCKLNDTNEKEYLERLNNLYCNCEEFHVTNPAERMSNLIAAKYEFLVSKKIKGKYKLDRSYEENKFLKAKLAGYDFSKDINSPTINHFLMMKDVAEKIDYLPISTILQDLIDELKVKSNILSFREKIYYGLNLNEKECKKLSKQK